VRVGKLLLVIAALTMLLAACGSSEQGQTPPDNPVVPKGPAEQQKQSAGDLANAPADNTLTVTVPKMNRIKDSIFPNTEGDDEESLKDNAGIHLDGTGFPWQSEANVYLAGHRLGYPGYPSFLAFYDLDNLEKGDDIFVEDANGKKYTYKVSDIIEAEPTDLYLIEPVPGRNIVTLQTCTLPDYAKRLLVRGELVDST
jgi:sortase A